MSNKRFNRDDEIVMTIRENNGIRIKDLAKLLSMWDSNLRKRLNLLNKEGKVERFIQKDYTCVKIKK